MRNSYAGILRDRNGAMKGTVVVISSVDWHFTWQRHHDISAGLAGKGYQVLYVEPLPKRWPALSEVGRVWGRLTRSAQRAGTVVQEEPPEIELIAPLMLPDVGPIANWINQRVFLPHIADRLRRRISERPLIVLNYLATRAALWLQQALQPDVTVYDCITDWATDPFGRQAHLVEEDVIERADLVISPSGFLLDRLRPRHPRVVGIPPAVHYDLYGPSRRMSDRADRPLRCAYFGTIGLAVDVDLLREISRRYTLRLIGPAAVPTQWLFLSN